MWLGTHFKCHPVNFCEMTRHLLLLKSEVNVFGIDLNSGLYGPRGAGHHVCEFLKLFLGVLFQNLSLIFCYKRIPIPSSTLGWMGQPWRKVSTVPLQLGQKWLNQSPLG
jgi:hypothetical protein